MRDKKNKVINPNKIGAGRLFAWHSRTFAVGVISIVWGYLNFYCTDVLGMPAALVGIITMLASIFDGVTDLIAGWIVDNTNTRLGKARPYELCIIGACIAQIFIFSIPVGWSMTAKAIVVFIMNVLEWSIFITLLNAAETPYVIRAFGTSQAVVKVASYGGVIVTLASMVVTMALPIIVERMGTSAESWSKVMLLVSVSIAIIGIMRFVFVKEDRIEYIEKTDDSEIKEEKVKIKDIFAMMRRNKYVWFLALAVAMPKMIGGFSAYVYYFNVIVGSMSEYSIVSLSSLLMIIVMIFVPVLMKKFSAMQLFALASGVGFAGYIINYFAGSNIALLFFAAIGTGISCMPYSYLKSPVIMRLAEYNSYSKMPRMEGSIASIVNFVEKVSRAFGAFIFGVLLSASGYDGTLTTQPDSAVDMIRWSYSLIPAFAMLIVIYCAIKFRPLDKLLDSRNN